MVGLLLGTTHPEMRVTDCADAGTPTIVDVLTPTHRTIEVTVEDITPLSMKMILGIGIVVRTLLVIADTADTVTTITHRDGEGAEGIMTMIIYWNVDGAEDMVKTKKIQKIGRVTDVVASIVIEMIGTTLRERTGSTPPKIQAELPPMPTQWSLWLPSRPRRT